MNSKNKGKVPINKRFYFQHNMSLIDTKDSIKDAGLRTFHVDFTTETYPECKENRYKKLFQQVDSMFNEQYNKL